MKSKERIINSLLRKPVDRTPIVNIFNMNYIFNELKNKKTNFTSFYDLNLRNIIDLQESIFHDPIYYLHTFQEPELVKLPEKIIKNYVKSENWVITEEIVNKKEENVIKRVYSTPGGSMYALLKREQFQAWVLKYPMDERNKIDLLQYRPDPDKLDFSQLKKLVKELGEDKFSIVGIPSVWQEACAMRGMNQLIYDMFDDPTWLKTFLSLLANYSVKIANKLSETGINGIFINESYVGVGMSRETYLDYVIPYDKRIIDAANSKSLITSLHICGKCNVLLEDMAESGAHCIEPLASNDYSGDVDLADAYKRVGSRVGFWGGFKERVLDKDKKDVKEEFIRCMNAVNGGNGYILRGMGQVYNAKEENLKYLYDLVTEYKGI